MDRSTINIAAAQLNYIVGDIEGNAEKIISTINNVKATNKVDCIIFTELALIGYPPEDLLFRPRVMERIKSALAKICEVTLDTTVIVGAPWEHEGHQYNAAVVIKEGKISDVYFKQALPNYDVFDEKRYFSQGEQACVFSLKGVPIGLAVCEDVWEKEPVSRALEHGAQLIININASPYHTDKQSERENQLKRRVDESGLPIIYVNQVGGQDELVFDGGSFAISKNKSIIFRAKSCEEDIVVIQYDVDKQDIYTVEEANDECSHFSKVYKVLQLGLHDYVFKNGFRGGLIGLSGGVDSALALTLAVDALGAENVRAVMMPSPYTSMMSLEDAEKLALNLGVEYSIINIESIMSSFEAALGELFLGYSKDTTEENIQARIRGVLLMAMSNKFGHMLITTGNKSEMAVGYATLYGDMAGGFAPLKDVPKTLVFELCNYRNTVNNIIPQRIIDRPPSAELAPDQLDEDSLPPYDVLDKILEMFVEQDCSREAIIAEGFAEEEVSKVIRLVFQNEYKRRQAPPGIKITKRAFGKDRRYPITSGVLNYLDES